MSLERFYDIADKLAGEYDHACRTVKSEKSVLIESCKKLEAAEDAQKIVQHIAQAVQQQAHDKIASVVSRCLESIFDDPYEFRIVFERKRGKTEARLVFVREEAERDPTTETGGGAVDVAAFALRLACMVLSMPRVRHLLVLDEPFKFLSAEYRPRVRAMLEMLADELGVQFIMVTHIEELRTGTILEVK